MPGAYVFPGGAVDPADDSAGAEARCSESRVQLDARLLLGAPDSAGPLAYGVAALRECFEECGLWLGANALVDAHALGEARRRLLDGSSDFIQLSIDLGLSFATRELAPWSRWITPIDAAKRFDTVFFVAVAPFDQLPAVDERETTNLVWVGPVVALRDYAAGMLPLEFATRRTLESLLPYASASALMQAARTPRRLEAIHPRVARTVSGERRVLLALEKGYDDVMRLDPEGTGSAVLPGAAVLPALSCRAEHTKPRKT